GNAWEDAMISKGRVTTTLVFLLSAKVMVCVVLAVLPLGPVHLQVRSMILLHPSVVVFSSSWTLTSLSQLSTAVSVAAFGTAWQQTVRSTGSVSTKLGSLLSSMVMVWV